ncbi:MAG: alcohol dehydrogenase catalytic domain-containing protein [Planctomycetaceae bacterium]|nr:alcohol dehydrogenase catalytic domain-containing protein [Planctomycetaceae bacterium]
MRGAFYIGAKELEIREVPMPEPGSGEVRIKVEFATLCGTDVHIVAGEYFSRPPVILGHEFSGRIEKLGPGVSAAKLGELVTVEPHKYCRVCKYCKTGREHLCIDKRAYGSYYNGGFAQYSVIPENTAYVVPDGVTAREAALTEVLGCCIHGLERARIRQGDVVAILGCSSVGMLFIKLARRAGAARIIVSEPNEERRGCSVGYGADVAVHPRDLHNALKTATGGLGPDVVIECSGVPAATEQAIAIAGKGANILVFGVAPPGKTIEVEPNILFKKELSLFASNINPFTHYRAVHMLPTLDIGSLITHTFPLARINEALDLATRGIGFKIGIEPNA